MSKALRTSRTSVSQPSTKGFERAFKAVWKDLFHSPRHLDALLSDVEKEYKSALAPIIQAILQRPVTLAHALRVRLRDREPWTLGPHHLAEWPAAATLARILYETGLDDPRLPRSGEEHDFPPLLKTEWHRHDGWDVEALARTLSSTAPLALRLNRKAKAEEVALSLRPAVFDEGLLSPRALVSPEYASVLRKPLHEAGAYEIQDEGSQCLAWLALAPEVFGPLLTEKPGGIPARWPDPPPALPRIPALTVIDACAGAGGKTLALSDGMANRGRVYAYDVSARKLEALKKRAKRAGLTNIQTLALPEGEERTAIAGFDGRADVVLVDAPCSGWGVLRRNPDLKWRQTAEELKRFPLLQAHLLQTFAPLLKSGGRLVYTVCTFRTAETTQVADAFETKHPGFKRRWSGFIGPGPSDGFAAFVWEKA